MYAHFDYSPSSQPSETSARGAIKSSVYQSRRQSAEGRRASLTVPRSVTAGLTGPGTRIFSRETARTHPALLPVARRSNGSAMRSLIRSILHAVINSLTNYLQNGLGYSDKSSASSVANLLDAAKF